MLNIGLEVQQQIRGSDGTILWSGAQVLANTFMMKVAAASTGPLLGEAVQWDETNSVIPRPETTAAGGTPTADLPMSVALYGKVSAAAINTPNLIGVAQQAIPAGKDGLVAGDGSLVCVKSTAGAIALGVFVGSSATAGAVALQAVGGSNCVLGAVFKVNTVAAPGTGSTGFVGIHIKGGSSSAT